MANREQLNLWDEKGKQIEEALELITHLECSEHIEWTSCQNPRQVVCQYFGIDIQELDKERRALLEEHRQAQEVQDAKS